MTRKQRRETGVVTEIRQKTKKYKGTREGTKEGRNKIKNEFGSS
jgi:hypothetical protein